MLSALAFLVLLPPATPPLKYWRGVDASFVPQYRDLKAEFFVGKQKTDPLKALADAGNNLLRLRVWVNPKDGYCDLNHTLVMARDAKKLGMDLQIDFHYSDWWADPGNQTPPDKWKNLTFDELEKTVEVHSREVIQALVKQGTPPVIVQVGNEIRPGMLWPFGQISKSGFGPLAKLIKAGIRGVRGAMPPRKPSWIMIHNDAGGDAKGCLEFYTKLQEQKVDFDMIGLSFYPWWHGSLADLKANMTGLVGKFRMPINVTETAYPFSNGFKDKTNNFVYEKTKMNCDFPATPDGQAQFLRELHKVVRSLPNRLGTGVSYWAPEYVAHPGIETPYENLTLFDFDNRLLPGAIALGERK
jgi:arabinogalactan endo-1,4-beta-galactosidase